MPKLTRAEFDRLHSTHNMKLIYREELGPGVTLLISEGLRDADEEMDEMHWLVSWATSRDEFIIEVKEIRVPYWIKIPDSSVIITAGTTVPSRQEDRIAIAKEDAHKWFKNSKKFGWA